MRKKNLRRESKLDRTDKVVFNYVCTWMEQNNYNYWVRNSQTWQELYDRFKVYYVFNKWFFEYNKLEFDFNLVIDDLRKELPSLKRILKRIDYEAALREQQDKQNSVELTFESDLRRGTETYGFDNNYGNICYINSKWSCQFRLRWLIEMVELKWKYMYNETDDDWYRVKDN